MNYYIFLLLCHKGTLHPYYIYINYYFWVKKFKKKREKEHKMRKIGQK